LFYQLKSHFIRLFVDLLKIRVFSMVHCVAKFVCDNETLNSIWKITVNSYSSDIMRSNANVKKKVGQCLKKTRPPTLEKNQATWPKNA